MTWQSRPVLASDFPLQEHVSFVNFLRCHSSYPQNIFLIPPWKLMLWYSLEAPRWGASNEYPQYMFLWRNKKNIIRWKLNLIWSYGDMQVSRQCAWTGDYFIFFFRIFYSIKLCLNHMNILAYSLTYKFFVWVIYRDNFKSIEYSERRKWFGH